MPTQPRNYGELLTREQLILALELYCRIPFRSTRSTNPHVVELAGLIGRSPGAVARKLGNFGAFDPRLAARNITGLPHNSQLDEAIWREFEGNWNQLVLLASAIRAQLGNPTDRPPVFPEPTGPSERLTQRAARLHQEFFRDAVLSSYSTRCCITGLPLPECLIAGHIIPWSVEESRRADPTNGLCLSATFERLFDRGLVAVAQDHTVMVSDRIRKLRDQSVVSLVSSHHGRPILLPDRFPPDPASLAWHRNHVFQAQ